MCKKSAFFLYFGFFAVCGYSEEQINVQEEAIFMTAPIFTPPGDISLQMSSLEVPFDEILSEEVQAVIDRMFEVARGERDETGDKCVMVGLAAPQIGINKRIILVDIGCDDNKNLGTLEAYINPEITYASSEVVEGREGCYSVDRRVVGIVPRPQTIFLKAFDRHGDLVEWEVSGFTARIFQHEVDHLNGIRFPDRVGSEGKLFWVEEEQYAEYKKSPETWPCKCPWDLWQAMKNDLSYLPPVTLHDTQKRSCE